MQRFLTSSRLASLFFGFMSAFALGCVVTIGGSASDGNGLDDPKTGTCDDPNSELINDQCFCKTGYQWCDPDDLNDLSCCLGGQTSQGTSTVTDGGTGTDGGTTADVPTTSQGTTGGPAVCNEAVTPDGACTDGQVFCSHPDTCTPEGSTFYVCQGGAWVDQTASLDQDCQLNDEDFAYGCVDSAADMQVYIECGSGSGAACQGGVSSCLDDNTLAECKWGKQSETDCFKQCTEKGDAEGVLYDFGSCGEQAGVFACLCCDEGDEGCPINDGGTSSGGSTG